MPHTRRIPIIELPPIITRLDIATVGLRAFAKAYAAGKITTQQLERAAINYAREHQRRKDKKTWRESSKRKTSSARRQR